MDVVPDAASVRTVSARGIGGPSTSRPGLGCPMTPHLPETMATVDGVPAAHPRGAR